MDTVTIIIVAVVVAITFLLLYTRYTKKKYGRSPISKIGIAIETICVGAFAFFYYQYLKGQTDNKLLLISIIALAISVAISVLLYILNCKKMKMKIGEIIVGAFAQIIGFLVIIPAIIKILFPAFKAVVDADRESAARSSGPKVL